MLDTTLVLGIIALNMVVLALIAYAAVRFIPAALEVPTHEEAESEPGGERTA